MLRRLMTIGRCRRIFSEIELIAIASTNFVATAAKLCGTTFVATFTKPSGTRLSTKEPLSPKIPIFTFSFDDFVLDRFNFFSSRISEINCFSNLQHAQLEFRITIFHFAFQQVNLVFGIISPKRKRMPVQAGN